MLIISRQMLSRILIQKNLVGLVEMCGPLSKPLTLFTTKICDFLLPIYDLTKNLTLQVMTVVTDIVVLNIIFEGLFMVLTIMMKK